MKKIRLLTFLILTVLLGTALSACTGAGAISNWPGVLVDSGSDTAYLASSQFIYAVNLANGTERWRYPEKAQTGLSFYAAPALTSDGQLIAGSYENKLYSINPNSRQQNWVYDAAKDKYVAQPLVVDSTVYAPNTDKHLYALDKTGGLLWKASGEHAFWSTPVTDGKLVYVSSMDHHVYAFDPGTGKQVWTSADLGGAMTGKVALDPAGKIYVGTLGSKMMALDAASGKVLWQTPAKGWVWAGPLIAGDQVIFDDLDGNVYSLNASDGQVKWQVQPDKGNNREITSAPVATKDTLYFASQSGTLYAVDLATGNPRWNKSIGGQIYSDLVLAGDKILVAPMNFSAALVLADQTGNITWSYTPAK